MMKQQNDENTVTGAVEPAERVEEINGTHDPVQCGCLSCGGRAVPADDLETRRKIERYRSKRHG